MRLSFRAMIATWVLSLTVAIGFKLAIRSASASTDGSPRRAEREISSVTPKSLVDDNPRAVQSSEDKKPVIGER